MRRILALLLSVCLAATCPPALADVTTPSDLTPAPIETPDAAPTPAPELSPASTESPDVPAEIPADTTAAPEAAECPTAAPETVAEASTEAPADPTETPVAAASTAAPEAAETPADPDEPWDEALCDHMNPRCAEAPGCGLADCAHIGQDVHGLDIPLCALGRWLIDRQEARSLRPRTVRRAVIDLDKGDATLWRSGAYTVRGGSTRKATLTAADGRTVSLLLEDAVLDTLTLGEKDDAYINTAGHCVLSLLTAGKDVNVTFGGDGALVVADAQLPAPGGAWGQTRVTGGSVHAALRETDGRQRYSFDAAGLTGVTVANSAYPLACADTDGKAYLWLPVPDDGLQWIGTMHDGLLVVTQTAQPDQTPTPTEAPDATDTPAPAVTPEVATPSDLTDAPTPTATPAPTETPDHAVPHLCLTVRDEAGTPVGNTPLTLRVGDVLYPCVTLPDGTLHLWELAPMDQRAVTATDGSRVWSCVAMAGHGELIPGLTIQDVRCADGDDDAVIIRFTCEGAATAGVQYVIGSEEAGLPDAFVSEAAQVYAENGKAVIRGVKAGQLVSLRVFAANAAGVVLSDATDDGCQFSEIIHWRHRKPYVVKPGAADAVYTGKAYRLPFTLPEGASVSCSGTGLTAGSMPILPGQYALHITIPRASRVWQPGTIDVPFEIRHAAVRICPEPNQEKYAGEEDPVLLWHAENLPEGVTVTGEILREPGEDVGNYAFDLSGLTVPEGYRLQLTEDAPVFTILPTEEWFTGAYFSGMYEKLHPVRQQITRDDGRTLYVVLNTQDKLTVRNSVVGQVIRATDTDRACAFTPSLSWNREADQVLLRLRAEPDLNPDKGFVTNPDGSLRWGGRCLRISWLALRNLHELGVDAVSLQNGGAALTLPLNDVLDDALASLVKHLHGSLQTARFRLTIEPVTDVPAPVAALRPVTDGWRMSVVLITDGTETDVTGLLPGLTAAADLEPTAELMKRAGLYDEASFAGRFTLCLYDAQAALPDTAFIVPFQADETEQTPWLHLMSTHRYLTAPITQAGTLWCVRK